MDDLNNREFTRFNFNAGMWVKVVPNIYEPSEFRMYQLIDISQGGISFKCHEKGEFKRGVEFYITEIDGQNLDKVLFCKVRYVRPIDKFGVDLKVGVEFISKI